MIDETLLPPAVADHLANVREVRASREERIVKLRREISELSSLIKGVQTDIYSLAEAENAILQTASAFLAKPNAISKPNDGAIDTREPH